MYHFPKVGSPDASNYSALSPVSRRDRAVADPEQAVRILSKNGSRTRLLVNAIAVLRALPVPT